MVNSPAAVSITRTNYHGWSNSLLIANETVEALVVPAIGRVMQFRFVGEPDGPFFENRAMDGKAPIPTSKEWGNFGGDKTWPSPQDAWPKITPRAWPPPVAFDSMPVEAKIEGDTIRLISAVDPDYGIRAERVIALAENTKLTIQTTYYKVKGEPRKVGVWIITQLSEPEDILINHPGHWLKQSDQLPRGFQAPKQENGAIHLKRDPAKPTKIGTQDSALHWKNSKWTLDINSPRLAGEEYPDQGSSAEVYTNPNPLAYVELEMLGPVKTLNIGDTLAQTNTYTLGHRSPTEFLVKEESN